MNRRDSRIGKNCHNNYQQNRAYYVEAVLDNQVIDSHECLGEGRQIARSNLFEYVTESRDNQGHNDYDNKNHKSDHEGGVSYCLFDLPC